MPDEAPMVTTCPLCLRPDEVSSIVTIEIDRAFGIGPTAIMICRICAGAVIEAAAKLDDPLLHGPIKDVLSSAEPAFTNQTWSAAAQIYGAFGDDPSWLESAQLHEGEDWDDGKATD